jgi:predicted SprT family Zn-dependent metalloprotease
VATIDDVETRRLAERYVERLNLGDEPLAITTDRARFEDLLGRRVNAAIGGGYVYHPRRKMHLVLINLPRIDRSQPNALEVVVAEELLHMRDWIDGDRRRHAKHGYDRIAVRVGELTGASLEEIRSCLLPREKRPVRYHYRCPGCARVVERRRKGTWSCGRCAPGFDARFVLVLERDLKTEGVATAAELAGSNRR